MNQCLFLLNLFFVLHNVFQNTNGVLQLFKNLDIRFMLLFVRLPTKHVGVCGRQIIMNSCK